MVSLRPQSFKHQQSSKRPRTKTGQTYYKKRQPKGQPITNRVDMATKPKEKSHNLKTTGCNNVKPLLSTETQLCHPEEIQQCPGIFLLS